MYIYALKQYSKKARKGSQIILPSQNSRERKGIPRSGSLCLSAYNAHKGGPMVICLWLCCIMRQAGEDQRKG